MAPLFDIAVATIFAREVLEGCIIVGNYRTVIKKSDEIEPEEKVRKVKAVYWSAAAAALVAFLLVVAVAIPLAILSKQFDARVGEIIEGISKIVAAVCILQLSLKIPTWLGVYEKVSLRPWKRNKPKKNKAKEELLTLREIRFNVAWNIWREVAECGVFLLPYFLNNDKVSSIPLSAFVGIIISLAISLAFFYANSRMTDKFWIAVVMVTLTVALSVGLFAGGCFEFDESLCLPSNYDAATGTVSVPPAPEGAAPEGVVPEGAAAAPVVEGAAVEGVAAEGRRLAADAMDGGMTIVWDAGRQLLAEAEGTVEASKYYCTPTLYRLPGNFLAQDRFPMALAKPFGYSSSPTLLHTIAFWFWLTLSIALHSYLWYLTKDARATRAAQLDEDPESKPAKLVDSPIGGSPVGGSPQLPAPPAKFPAAQFPPPQYTPPPTVHR